MQYKTPSPFGVLIIHGFTATLESVKALYMPLRDLGIPVRMPQLAGHGASSPEALRGVRWEAWMADAEQAFKELRLEAERVIVIGHSMGALIALNLAVRYQNQVDSLVLAAPAIKLASLLAPGRPLHFAAPLVSLFIKRWELKTDYAGIESQGCTPHYPWVPTDAIVSFFELIKKSLSLLGKVNVPVFILHNRRESTVLPESATILCNSIATAPSEKSIMWLERSEHQIFCDCESDVAVKAIIDYVSGRIGRKSLIV
ncbi:MAG: alpha/beta fold hydrolase [Chlorobiaceae bacterium]|nr:alpha/beta fold hydrolase [Chlorobiaceae bacterium]